MFSKIKNMDTAFRQLRNVVVLVIVSSLLLLIVSMTLGYRLLSRTQDRIYVLANGKAFQVFASSTRDNIPVEAREHIRSFHQYFFTLDPDEKAITHNLQKALYLADLSAKRIYDDLQENGFYASVISGNVNQTILVDSIQVDIEGYPHKFRCFATQRIVRPKSLTMRELVTEGYLRRVSRSDNNPHGFLIERWRTIINRDLSTKSRY